MPPTYRDRLRVEGAVLTLVGALGSAALLALTEQSRRGPLNTGGQVLLVGLGLRRFGPRSVRRAVAGAHEVSPPALGTGEPTPLWHIPLPVLAFALLVKGSERLPGPAARRAGWDASLRVTLGSAIVGLAQLALLEPAVAAAERRTGRTYYRRAGARLGRGTPLAYPTQPST